MIGKTSRTQNTKRNIIVSYIQYILQMVFQFASRSIIVYTLGEQYLGLSSLFASILHVLNMADLGFSTSIIYNMYKPLADKDTVKVRALLALYNKIYKIVGAIILVCGLCVTPFLKSLIHGSVPDDINLYVLYILYLINTSVSYLLFAHKTALLTALQRLDLTKIATIAVHLVQYTLQVISLLLFRNYYLFVIILILGTASTNVLNAVIAKKNFPEYYCKGSVDDETKKDIWHRVKGLLICNVSGVTYTSLDSIILSAFLGLTSVAIYSNYLTVYNAVSSFIGILRSSMQASVGNSVAIETPEKNYKDMQLWQFLFSCLGSWCMCCLICLYQPFMELWMGKNMLLPMLDVVMLGIWLLLTVVQHAFYLYLAAKGLWNELKWPYIFSTVLNLSLNIIMGKLFGTTGIILASVISCFVCGMIWQCTVIFKLYFKRSARPYLLKQGVYFVVAGIICYISYQLCSFVKTGGVMSLILKACICAVFTTVSLFLAYSHTEQFKKAKLFALRVIKSRQGLI